MSRPLVVLTSAGSEQQALTIAEELIQLELAASINVLPTMRSVYRFKGKVFDDEENLLIIKTCAELFDEVANVITQLHTYEVPEIIGIEADKFKKNICDWIMDSVKVIP